RAGKMRCQGKRIFLVRSTAALTADADGQLAAGEDDGAAAGILHCPGKTGVRRGDFARLPFDALAEKDALVAGGAHRGLCRSEGVGGARDNGECRARENRVARLWR